VAAPLARMRSISLRYASSGWVATVGPPVGLPGDRRPRRPPFCNPPPECQGRAARGGRCQVLGFHRELSRPRPSPHRPARSSRCSSVGTGAAAAPAARCAESAADRESVSGPRRWSVGAVRPDAGASGRVLEATAARRPPGRASCRAGRRRRGAALSGHRSPRWRERPPSMSEKGPLATAESGRKRAGSGGQKWRAVARNAGSGAAGRGCGTHLLRRQACGRRMAGVEQQ